MEKVVRELKKIPYGHRMNIIVDDDINLDDPRDVMWAVGTRCEPKTGSYIYDGESSDQMHPMMPREAQETKGTFPYSKIALNACRPYDRIKDFAPVSVFSEAMREKVRKKWGNDAFGPPRL